MSDRLSRLINNNDRLFFISPHFDDIALSCGGLLYEAAKTKPGRITIINVFTKAKTGYNTSYNSQFVHNCGFTDAKSMFEARQKEEDKMVELLKINSLSLGLIDAAWRRGDSTIKNQLFKEIKKIGVGKSDNIFIPLAMGNHRDHLLSRSVGELFSPNKVVYYSDFPYNIKHQTPTEFILNNKLIPTSWIKGLSHKEKLIYLYESQLNNLFPKGSVPILKEVYYLS